MIRKAPGLRPGGRGINNSRHKCRRYVTNMDAVVFDLNGLMFNTEDVYTLVGSELLRRSGCEFTSDLKDAMMGLPPQASARVDDPAARFERCLGEWQWNRMIFFLPCCRTGWP